MKTITINVTKRDIERGLPGSNHSCAIALAASRKLTNVLCTNTVLFYGNSTDYVSLPFDAQNFTMDFDDGKPVKPIKFPVRVP